MSSSLLRPVLLAISIILVTAACASTPRASAENPSQIYAAGLDRTRAAALEALAETGFDIRTESERYLEGFRPRKVGLFVGSGGETIGIWLEPQGADSTRVQLRTAKSLVGIAGQKNWDGPVLESIAAHLGG